MVVYSPECAAGEMEDAKNSGTARSPRNSSGCQSKSSSSSLSNLQQQQNHMKDNSPRSASAAGLPPFSRPHPQLLMAPQQQQQHTTTSNSIGQSQSHQAWTTTATDWDSAPNISETTEGTTNGSDYHGGRSSGTEWDVKICQWDWEQMSTMCAPGREGRGAAAGEGAHSSKGSYTMCPSSESGSIGGGGVAGGASNRLSLPKIEPDLGNGNGGLDSNRIVNLVVDRRAGQQQQQQQQQSSVASIGEHCNRLLLGLGGVDDASSEGRRRYCQDHCNSGAVKTGASDTMIGLKLGRREYFEDAVASARSGGPTPFAVCPPGKKQRVQSTGVQIPRQSPGVQVPRCQRVQSPGVQVPRCQVDGCRQDLSSAKDYHRRHKVCETHAKSSSVMLSGLEQRFCQQCSRFHILTEFDEGKRSCRRRLAGHNERRRKPQPESAAIASTGSSAALHPESGSHASSFSGEEDKRGTSGLAERGCYLPTQRTPGSSSTSVEENSDDQSGSMGTTLKLNQGRSLWQGIGRVEEATGLVCQVPCGENQQQPYLTHSTTQRMLTMMHNPKGVHQFMLEGSGGPGLTLASTTGTTSVLSTLEAPSSTSASGLSDSGRALSLLSSQAWGSRGGAPGSVSLDLSSGPGVALLDQLISEKSGGLFPPRRQQSRFPAAASSTAENLFPLQPHSVRVESRDQHRGFISGMNLVGSGFDGGVLALMQGNPDFLANYGAVNVAQRPTIDLMRLPSPQSHSSSTHPSAVQSVEFSALRSFESFESLL